MVNPLLLIAVPLAWAFIQPLVARTGKVVSRALSLGVMTTLTASAVYALAGLLSGIEPVVVQTAGFMAPLSINLQLDVTAAWILAVVYLVGLGTLASQLIRREGQWESRQIILFFVLMLGATGLILTRDLFNVFVFLEISGIAVYGLLSTSRDQRIHEAGFKYMVAGGLSSVFFLIGVTVLYVAGGSLNLDTLGVLAEGGAFNTALGLVGLSSLLAAVLIELKPVLANGWAMDAYEAADPGFSALMSGAAATAVGAVLIKILPLFSGLGGLFPAALTVLGLIGFVLGNLQAMVQPNFRRTLGYSSSAQIGLVIAVLGMTSQSPVPGFAALPVALGLLLNHALAKSGLFWLSEQLETSTGVGSHALKSLRSRPVILVLAGVFVFALLGLPPFPGFSAKWNLLSRLGGESRWLLMALVLVGSLLEAVYLLRWYTGICRSETDPGDVETQRIPADWSADESARDHAVPQTVSGVSAAVSGSAAAVFAALAGAFILLAGGTALLWSAGVSQLILLPVLLAVLFGLFDLVRVPNRIQVLASIAGLALFGWYALLNLEGIRAVFALIFVAGAAVQLVAFLTRKGHHPGLNAFIMAMITSLAGLVLASTRLEFFISWELMTLASFFLILRGRRARAGALGYILFSLAGAFLVLFALTAMPGDYPIDVLGRMLLAGSLGGALPIAAGFCLALGFLIKAGALGVHVWLPSAYAEAEDDVSSLLSSVLSKAALFGFFVTAGFFVQPLITTLLPGFSTLTKLDGVSIADILGWIGVATAVAGSLMALFQEDIKYTLAYSSMGQLGYMILGFAMMSHLGWVSSLYLAATHLFFKALLFLAIAGVIQQTGTRMMYQMGGLIKRMPLSFLSVLLAIIALSGVPPLTGFGAKWLMYTALLEKGWYLQAGLAMFSSGVAFLYLFRLIHSIFLGQLKTIHREVREASVWTIIPQFLFMGVIMLFSMFPDLLIKPLQSAVEPWFATTVNWNGYAVISALGYWNGNAVMYVTMGVFGVPLVWLLIVKGRTYWVRQFNIVFSAERPLKPETTHYAYNFFGHYQKALGFLVKPHGRSFWSAVGRTAETLSDGLRRWNTGNTQAYALQVVLYTAFVYLLLKGGF